MELQKKGKADKQKLTVKIIDPDTNEPTEGEIVISAQVELRV